MQSQIPHAWQVSHRTVGHVPNATKGSQDCGMHVAKERTQPRRLVQVFQHYNSRRWYLENAVPPICPIVVKASDHRWFASAKTGCRGIAHHGRPVFEHAAYPSVCETCVSQANRKSLDRIRNRAGIETPKLFEHLNCYGRFRGHPDPFQFRWRFIQISGNAQESSDNAEKHAWTNNSTDQKQLGNYKCGRPI